MRFKKSSNFLLDVNVKVFERLMCEVEFWEVFYKVLGFLAWCPKVPRADCRIGNIVSQASWNVPTLSCPVTKKANVLFFRLNF